MCNKIRIPAKSRYIQDDSCRNSILTEACSEGKGEAVASFVENTEPADGCDLCKIEEQKLKKQVPG